MNRGLVWMPLVAFLAVAALVGYSIYRPADRAIHSSLVSKPLPAFALPPIVPGKPGLASSSFGGGRGRLINVFASWCIPCAAEAPQLARLQRLGVPIEAIAVRDTPAAVTNFLQRYGDPYAAIGDDHDSATQLALGSSGVPESFVVDGRGRIVAQHIGDIRAEDVADIAASVRVVR